MTRFNLWKRSGARSAGTRTGKKTRRGFTLIELSIAISILMIGMVSVVSATSRMHGLRKQNRQRTIAQNAVRSVAERIHARSYEFSATPSTWAENLIGVYGQNGTVGDTFEVTGLNPLGGEGPVGSIRIVTDETETDAGLGFQVGMPRDLNGNGVATDADVSGDARILPVLLTVQWRGQNGRNTYTHAFYVMGY